MAEAQENEIKREFRASARNIRMSAQKAALVMDTVRGKSVLEAVTILDFVNKRAAPYLKKVIQSAVSNAEDYANKSGIDIDADNLVVFECRADQGPILKRFRPRSRGMANLIQKKTCHISVAVAEPEYLEKKLEQTPTHKKPRSRMSKDVRKKLQEAKKATGEAREKLLKEVKLLRRKERHEAA